MLNSFRTWMLPEGVVEALPDEAVTLNRLEQTAISTFARWGYELLRPPMMEYADTFTGNDANDNLIEQTIQFKDQKSGKQLGFRADITPQIARIDAHYLQTDKVARYAYTGEVVRSYPAGHGRLRNPSVAGVELLGSSSQQADIEIVSLLIDYLTELQLPDFMIGLGNVDIVATLLRSLSVSEAKYPLFFDAFSKKDTEKLTTLAVQAQLTAVDTELLVKLTQLYGDSAVLDEAHELLAAHQLVLAELEKLAAITHQIQHLYPAVRLHVDLSDVHGYGYHNGLIFAAYASGVWQPIARGGRYDSFGNHFGENANVRPSTGFSCDLNLLAGLVAADTVSQRIIAYRLSDVDDFELQQLTEAVRQLRQQGDTVIQLFDETGISRTAFTHQLVRDGVGFSVSEITR